MLDRYELSEQNTGGDVGNHYRNSLEFHKFERI